MHERPEGFEVDSDACWPNIDRVKQALNILLHQKRGRIRDLNLVADYSPTNVSEKVVHIIHSYGIL